MMSASMMSGMVSSIERTRLSPASIETEAAVSEVPIAAPAAVLAKAEPEAPMPIVERIEPSTPNSMDASISSEASMSTANSGLPSAPWVECRGGKCSAVPYGWNVGEGSVAVPWVEGGRVRLLHTLLAGGGSSWMCPGETIEVIENHAGTFIVAVPSRPPAMVKVKPIVIAASHTP